MSEQREHIILNNSRTTYCCNVSLLIQFSSQKASHLLSWIVREFLLLETAVVFASQMEEIILEYCFSSTTGVEKSNRIRITKQQHHSHITLPCHRNMKTDHCEDDYDKPMLTKMVKYNQVFVLDFKWREKCCWLWWVCVLRVCMVIHPFQTVASASSASKS